MRICGYFAKPKGGPRAKKVWEALVEHIIFFCVNCGVAGGETFFCEKSRTLEGNINDDCKGKTLRGVEMDGTVSGSCPVTAD